jgi:hypothetical protein
MSSPLILESSNKYNLKETKPRGKGKKECYKME